MDSNNINNEKHFVFKTINPSNRVTPEFSGDCNKYVYTQYTVMYPMLQLACYFGFKEIILLGVDCTFSHDEQLDGTIKTQDIINHQKIIEQEEKNMEDMVIEECGYKYLTNVERQHAGYISARNYAETHGIKIYNATRGGELEIFERIGFDTLFE